ncbi:MAG: T9SS type A sorting domain-containing protein [Candidatus Cloacimonetes bacterium]|nr:T9SS type A sorting domain-containing protein [Candidatus Cloacimonadota bacterium]MCF7813588.1 T9SS type A sorting domain-containing protein [Candidatus Cloacimonadota bacterium]MCF7868219.1 T9SS type A sorting domain-containing protein [Candidatus Cloacimonadota bacterium]MCF7883617.1 T9SS type A sorting domain-containing protein [Candidatus Cloacimonadota bacterium]
MKKIFFLIFLILVNLSLFAETIEHTYYFRQPQISEVGKYQIIEFENTVQAGITGEPSLPYFPVKLLLPEGKIAASIEVTTDNELSLSGNYQLYPMQPSRPLSLGKSGGFNKNETLYQSNSIFPDQNLGHLTTEFMNGFGFALCTITPISYIPATGEISYYREITVKIQLADDPNYLKSRKNLKSNSRIDKKVREFAQNPEIMNSYNVMPSNREGEYDVMIIATSDFEDSFQDLIDLNLARGFITEVVTITEINSTMTGQDLPEKMRNYIIQEYQDNDVSQIILAGDIELIPYRGFYCYVQSGSGYEDYGIPADLYFSALDGTWDDDGDGIWAEIGEDDLIPEIAVSRLTFNTQDELDNMLNKTMMYQTQPVLGELDSPLLAGENMYNNPLTWGGDYLDLLIGYHDDNGYETNGIPVDDDYLTMYDRDLGSWSANQLMNEINQGHSFIYHAGHCNYSYCMRLDDWQITNPNFSQVNGIDQNFSLIYTHGCNAGGFDVADCIAEYMVMIENFAAVYVGSSRYGWFNEGQTEGPSAHMNREFCDALYDADYYLIGEANMDSKIDTAPWVTAPGQYEEGALRWTFYGTNVLGDGLLPVWTDEPMNLDVTFNSNIFLGVTNHEVWIEENGNGIENVNCVLIQNGELVSVASTDNSGYADLQFDAASIQPGEISLFVSGNNCLLTEYQLQVIPAGYFIQVSDHSVFAGNDEVLEFGENALLSLTLQEVGNIGDIHNTEVTISESDDYITLNDDSEIIGTIASGSTIDLIDAFDFDVSNDVPDEHEFTIGIEISSDEGTWQSELDFMAFAADIHVESVIIDDGGNGILDPGETAVMQLELMNEGGADAYNVILNLQTTNHYISLLPLPLSIDSLNSGGSGTFPVCDITLDSSSPLGEVVSFDLEITADNGYFTENNFDLITGLLIEDFESGDFSAMDWSFSGDADWIIDDEVHEGVFSAKSGDISHYDDSSLEINYEVIMEGSISFWKKVSSEESYDFLRFYIDDILQEEWSGEDDWTLESFTVEPGVHNFRWTYYKDQAVTNGEDCGWIDYITFPPVNMNVSAPNNNISQVTHLIGNHPNPFNPTTTIDFVIAGSSAQTELLIYNIKGQKVSSLINNVLEAGAYSILWDGKDSKNRTVSSGIYFYKLKVGNVEQTRKMIMLK